MESRWIPSISNYISSFCLSLPSSKHAPPLSVAYLQKNPAPGCTAEKHIIPQRLTLCSQTDEHYFHIQRNSTASHPVQTAWTWEGVCKRIHIWLYWLWKRVSNFICLAMLFCSIATIGILPDSESSSFTTISAVGARHMLQITLYEPWLETSYVPNAL